MKKIKIAYGSKEFLFTYYQTTINEENIFFIQTTDKHAARLLVEDHFFIVQSNQAPLQYYMNAIRGDEREVKFKEQVSEAILLANVDQGSSYTPNMN